MVVTEHNQPVRGVFFLPEHPAVVTAGAEGQVRFIRWPEMTGIGTLYSPGGALTSLHIARTGEFMATGANDASLRLWDLRTLDIPALFAQPLATASHHQIATILALSEYETLPQPVRNALQFMRLLLQYRFRFDIHIEEAPLSSSVSLISCWEKNDDAFPRNCYVLLETSVFTPSSPTPAGPEASAEPQVLESRYRQLRLELSARDEPSNG
jgi:WD40 repeat protein